MPTAEELAKDAKFVFQGTVKKLRASNVDGAAANARTVIVHVDHLIRAVETLADYAGHDITVRLEHDNSLRAGQSYVFYANGWIFAETIAVQCVRCDEATAASAAALSLHPDDAPRSLGEHEAIRQAQEADLIVSGRVAAVRLTQPELRARNLLDRGQTSEPISEHAPMWREAVIAIDAVYKGEHAGNEVVVRFPASRDVRWHKAPKFEAGQEGVFLLHKGAAAAATGGMHGEPGAAEYTALHEADVQPLERLAAIELAARASENG
jgi:hypothetical protein